MQRTPIEQAKREFRRWVISLTGADIRQYEVEVELLPMASLLNRYGKPNDNQVLACGARACGWTAVNWAEVGLADLYVCDAQEVRLCIVLELPDPEPGADQRSANDSDDIRGRRAV